MKKIALTLEGEVGTIEARALADAIRETVGLLQSVANGKINCPLGNLQVGSAVVEILAPEREVGLIIDGLKELEHTSELPRGWNDTSLKKVHALEKICHKQGVKGISLGDSVTAVKFNECIVKNAQNAVARKRIVLGSIEGRIIAYSRANGKLTSKLVDREGRNVNLSAPLDLAPKFLELLEHQALVWGTLYRREADGSVIKVDVEDLSEARPQKIGGDVASFRGALEGFWPADLDPVEAVRALRD